MTASAPCLSATRYQKLRMLAIHNGTWRHPVDAFPSVELVREYLASGWTERQIEHAAGLHKDYISRLLGLDASVPAPLTLLPGTADAIASVAFADRYGPRIPDVTLVNATGSLRRIQALHAGGWPYSALAARGVRGVRHLASYTLTSARRARVIRGLFDELWDVPGPSSEAAEKAARRGFVPAMAWEGLDIDDPRSVPFGHVPVRRTSADLTESSDELLAQGVPMDVIADRLGVRLNTLVKARERTAARERAAAQAAVEAP